MIIIIIGSTLRFIYIHKKKTKNESEKESKLEMDEKPKLREKKMWNFIPLQILLGSLIARAKSKKIFYVNSWFFCRNIYKNKHQLIRHKGKRRTMFRS